MIRGSYIFIIIPILPHMELGLLAEAGLFVGDIRKRCEMTTFIEAPIFIFSH